MPYLASQAKLKSMDDDIINIFIEVAAFCLLGLLYYIWQKKRILRADINDIFHQLDKLTYDLNHYLDANKNESFYNDINKIIEDIEKEQDLARLKEHLLRIPIELSSEISNQRNTLIEQINFHCKSNS